jgi:hypothetical protein
MMPYLALPIGARQSKIAEAYHGTCAGREARRYGGSQSLV